MSKLQTSVIAALLAFGAVSLVIAYAQVPEGSSRESALLPAAQTETVPSVVPSSTEANLTPSESAIAPQSSQSQPAQANTPDVAAAVPASVSRGLIYLDPGHQRKGNAQQEPVSPGSRETKAKVTGGTRGVATGKPEYVLNLEVAVLLKEALIARGFEVQMTREDHDVDISNAERAEMANAADAQLAVRIHADGNDSPKAKGFSVLYPDAGVRSTQSIQPASQMAAAAILEALKAGTDAASRGMVARSDLSGFNWSKVPVVLIELGFMTNPTEDKQLSEPEYQQQLADAIADGIDSYMKNKED
ncbi:N-acetylmuramoyl-L-alanine amidase [Paenibacillus sp. WQ 127069]|uniref:N-acetylmuramoyl-L-alanine amidase n=1 Tax=Paenibacillus baimaensis TaxID=2982185 RepID=A0ABT2URR5_9BACL|nr:N-acetylmuramoyl-L-alanine amidase [Paenibacillus sp. WQ 127069]MCU6796389.1 N-acetylmuramoyl-L-alanine amidase [Paenibacillus sp. WQ 127069]